MGRAGRPLPAGVRDVGPVRHARADGARPARASQRPRASAPAICCGGRSRPTTARRSRGGCASSRSATSFRSAYAYDNVLYLVAGELIEAISGQTWEDFVATRILAKVGMTGSNVRHSAAAAGGNVADAARARSTARCGRSGRSTSDNTNPAGGINSSAEDMAKWLRVQLSGGVLADGSRLFSAATRAAADDDRHADSDWRSAARAAAAEDELPRLRARLRHPRLPRPQGGDAHRRAARLRLARGHDSRICNVGVAVLTNQESGEAFDAIAFHVARSLSRRAGLRLDRRLREGPRARGDAASSRGEPRRGRRATPRRSRRCRWRSTPAPTATPWYGDVTIARGRRQAGDALLAHAGAGRRPRALAARHVRRRAGATASCAPTPTSRSRSTPTARSIRPRCARCRRPPTSASTSRICC